MEIRHRLPLPFTSFTLRSPWTKSPKPSTFVPSLPFSAGPFGFPEKLPILLSLIFLFATIFFLLSKLIRGFDCFHIFYGYSEDEAKKALIYSYKTAASGFSAKLTAEQVSQISREFFLFQLLMKLFDSAGFLNDLGLFFFFFSFLMDFFWEQFGACLLFLAN